MNAVTTCARLAVWTLVATTALAGGARAACPPVTVADDHGLEGAYPQQFELAAFEATANCTLAFSENPDIAALNARIVGNPEELPPVAERLPQEPLVVAPYEEIGAYGGVLNGLSNATEAGTSDLLSLRHVNLVRFADDLETLVPNVAKSWEWNDDYTQLTFTLRRGHKWSDGAPFTAHDVVFWYDHLVTDENVVESPRETWLAGGEPFEVAALDDVTVRFSLAAPKPGLLYTFATDYAQPFQPRHFLGRFHPEINEDADALAQAAGFANGYEVINFYYGGSDWKDVPSPLFKDPTKIDALPAAVVPTLESHIVVEDSTEGRRVVANPYFFKVDTAGNQLPYINEIDELYVPDNQVRILKMINGEIDYKAQSVRLPDAPTLLDNQDNGDYTIHLRPQIGMPSIAFNLTANDEAKRELFQSRDFRLAMSRAIDREAINETAFFGQGAPRADLNFDPAPSFVDKEQLGYGTEHDPAFAMATLDELGVVDRDGDGFRDLPNGERLLLNLQFSSQGISAAVVELVAQAWSDVGVETTLKEVTSDEYRAAQSANELDVLMWTRGQPAPVLLGDPQQFIVPFGGYFGLRTGMLWARHLETDGAEGVAPPQWVYDWRDTILEWQTHPLGSAASDRLGAALVDATLDQFVFIGLVQSPNPVYQSNQLVNFQPPQTWSYEYYRMYPYRPQQWSLAP
jgi:peptide/nickel transport system substrate-binding protein